MPTPDTYALLDRLVVVVNALDDAAKEATRKSRRAIETAGAASAELSTAITHYRALTTALVRGAGHDPKAARPLADVVTEVEAFLTNPTPEETP